MDIPVQNIIEAHELIKPFIHKTPVLTSTTINELTGADIFFKCENLQKIGAFKSMIVQFLRRYVRRNPSLRKCVIVTDDKSQPPVYLGDEYNVKLSFQHVLEIVEEITRKVKIRYLFKLKS